MAATLAPAPPPATPAGPRWRVLAGVATAVLAAHAWLLDEVAGGGGARPSDRASAVSVRQIVLPASSQEPAAAPTAPTAAAPPPAPPRRRAAPPVRPAEPPAAPPPEAAAPPEPGPGVATPAPAPAPGPEVVDERLPAAPATSEPPPQVATIVDAAAPASEPAAGVAVVSSAVPTASAGPTQVPTYPTRVPPSAELAYTVRRGPISAAGTLRWRAEGGRYEMSLVGSLLGVTVLEQTSQGGFDAAGLAPERFTDRRSGRDLRAANFRRDSGQVSFSASTALRPLLPGTQDRLSWMAQLAAIALADPGRLLPGGQVSMVVVGSRGESDLWTFTVRQAQIDGLVELVREPRRDFDTRIEVWLHAQRGFWPVRALQTQQGGDGSIELTLDDGPKPLPAR